MAMNKKDFVNLNIRYVNFDCAAKKANYVDSM